jgi:hypothetical protein
LLIAILTDDESDVKENSDEIKKEELTKTTEELEREQKEQLEREIKSIDKGIDFSTYHNAVKADILAMEIALFSTWGAIIREGESSNNTEIKKLTTQLKTKVANTQVKEFPILRKRYAEIFSKLMWKHDIEISVSGTGSKYINITDGIFAANKNKQEFQDEIHDVLKKLRFNQSRYRWYKGESEYTYYIIYDGKDADIVDFK